MGIYWPWLAVAGLGALHGLNPATGWIFATASAVRTRDRSQAWRALLPIATGHIASLAMATIALWAGVSMGRNVVLTIAAGLLAIVVISHRMGDKCPAVPVGWAGLTLWSFVMSTAHGAGLMLLPVMLPLCSAAPGSGFSASSSLIAMLGGIALHTAAMLATTGLMADGARRCVDLLSPRALRGRESAA